MDNSLGEDQTLTTNLLYFLGRGMEVVGKRKSGESADTALTLNAGGQGQPLNLSTSFGYTFSLDNLYPGYSHSAGELFIICFYNNFAEVVEW